MLTKEEFFSKRAIEVNGMERLEKAWEAYLEEMKEQEEKQRTFRYMRKEIYEDKS